MSALPMHPTELDRERFRDLTKAIVAGLEYNRCPDGEYREATTQIAWRIWWSVERERQLLQNLNQSQGVKLSELLARAEKAEEALRSLASFVGAGGYNADKVDAGVFEQKIHWGIGQIMERLEKAEAELAMLRDQEPVAYRIDWPLGLQELGWQSDSYDEDYVQSRGLPNVVPLYAAHVPAVADKRVDKLAMLIRRLVRRLNQELPHNDIGEAAMDYLARNGISGEILRGGAAPVVPEEWRKVMVELADDLAIEIDQNYPPERRVYPSEQRRYEGEMEIVNRARALLQSAPQPDKEVRNEAIPHAV